MVVVEMVVVEMVAAGMAVAAEVERPEREAEVMARAQQ